MLEIAWRWRRECIVGKWKRVFLFFIFGDIFEGEYSTWKIDRTLNCKNCDWSFFYIASERHFRRELAMLDQLRQLRITCSIVINCTYCTPNENSNSAVTIKEIASAVGFGLKFESVDLSLSQKSPRYHRIGLVEMISPRDSLRSTTFFRGKMPRVTSPSRRGGRTN